MKNSKTIVIISRIIKFFLYVVLCFVGIPILTYSIDFWFNKLDIFRSLKIIAYIGENEVLLPLEIATFLLSILSFVVATFLSIANYRLRKRVNNNQLLIEIDNIKTDILNILESTSKEVRHYIDKVISFKKKLNKDLWNNKLIKLKSYMIIDESHYYFLRDWFEMNSEGNDEAVNSITKFYLKNEEMFDSVAEVIQKSKPIV